MDDYQEYFRMACIYTQVHASKAKNESFKPILNNLNTSKLNINLNINNNMNSSLNNPTTFLIDEQNKSSKLSFRGSLSNNIEESCQSNLAEANNGNYNNLYSNMSSKNSFLLRNSQKENNNIQYSTNGNAIPGGEEDYFRNLDEYSNMLLVNSNNNNNHNNHSNQASLNSNYNNNSNSLLFRHSKSFYLKNQNNIIYSNLLESNLINNTNNNLQNNYSLLARNSTFKDFQHFNSNEIFPTGINENQKPEENNIICLGLGLREESGAEPNYSEAFSSTSSNFGRMSNHIFTANSGNHHFGNFLNPENNRKPSLDSLPFMRSNSQTYNNDFNLLSNLSSNASSKAGFKTKKDEMKKWLSRI